MNICTIIAKNYVAHARVLAESFQAADPEGSCSVLVIDDHRGFIDPAEEPFEVIALDAIGLPDAERMAAAYDVTELSTAVKPWLLRHLLEREGIDSIAYLDPDIWIAESIAEIDSLAREHGIVLTPHFTEPLPRDGLKPSEEDILIAGAYNLGFIALSAGEASDQLLEWWSERLEHDCLIEPDMGRFVDQRWIDLVPGIWPHTHILRDTAYNVAYWNLPVRRFELGPDRGYTVDGSPLRFFHFSGFDPKRPKALSKHQNRIEVRRSKALTRVCALYAEKLLSRGFREACLWEYGWEMLPNGVRLDGPARRLFREATASGELGESIFSRRGSKRFVAHLNEVPAGNGGVSRYGRALHASRLDLRTTFPDIEGADSLAFNRWMHESADTLRISDHLLPSGPSALGRGSATAPAQAKGRLGVNLAGYLSSELGVGEAARQILGALGARGIPTTAIDVPVEAARFPATLGNLDDGDLPFDFNLICVNADMLPAVVSACPSSLFEGRHSAGLWFWEVEEFPAQWHDSFEHIDEVWVASDFVAEALRPISPVPITTVRVPLTPTQPADASREQLGMPEGFCFLYAFDHRSVFRRKNPLGAVEAFCRAFKPDAGANLVIKSMGAEAAPEDAAALAAAVGERPDIHLIDEVVSAAEKNAMIASCDCYVSLHRSEGLGLTMAEAMYFGRPVIATAYSGNLDFMTEDNSYLVPYKLARIGDDAGPYPASGRWAEPELEKAAMSMREVFEDRVTAAERGRRGGEDIRATHSPDAAGEVLEEHLSKIRRQRVLARLDPPSTGGSDSDEISPGTDLTPTGLLPNADSLEPTSGRAQLHHLLRFEEPPPRRGAGRLRRAIKRAYLRILRPYASHQHRIDVSARQSIDELTAELAALERRTARTGEEALESSRRSGDQLRAELSKLIEKALEIESQARSEEVDELGTEITEARQSIAAVQGSIGQLGDSVAEILDSTRETPRSIDSLREDAEQIHRELGSHQEQLFQALRLAEAAGTRMTEHQRETSEHRAGLRDAISRAVQENEQVVAETHGAINELRSRIAEGEDDRDAKPYMADDRFPTHDHPGLGRVIGFAAGSTEGGDPSYRAFEDLFRGPEEMIKERQRIYVDLVADHEPVFDAGCGRGEFLELLSSRGVEAQGVDLDEGMVARCHEKGLGNVRRADILETLESMPESSLGCVFSAQVIEHLDPDDLQRFLSLCRTRLRPGGVMIAETVNPYSPRALKTFWVDPTHRNPLFPETMLAFCGQTGFETADAFCPMGSGDWEQDRTTAGEYAIVASIQSG